jgi:hypothetical protein
VSNGPVAGITPPSPPSSSVAIAARISFCSPNWPAGFGEVLFSGHMPDSDERGKIMKGEFGMLSGEITKAMTNNA